jgi:hypothetical protein
MLKEDLVDWVLLQFESMGATPIQLELERLQLSNDTNYLLDFISSCSDLQNYHFHLAFED